MSPQAHKKQNFAFDILYPNIMLSFFPLKNNPKNLVLSYKTDTDLFSGLFEGGKIF